MDSTENFTSIKGVLIFLNFFFHFSVVKESKMQKIAKKTCFGQFEVQTNLERFLRYLSKKTYLNNFRNIISHVKFPEEFESFIRIQVRLKDFLKISENRKKYVNHY